VFDVLDHRKRALAAPGYSEALFIERSPFTEMELQWILRAMIRPVHELRRKDRIPENARVLQDRNPFGGSIIV
jgi:hypothetical protein